MEKICAKCTVPITGIEYVTCRGYCGSLFHLNTCSGVSRSLLVYFTSNKKNLFWMCDDCADLFENSHFRTISSKADKCSPLNLLTDAISELRSEIKNLNSRPTAQLSPLLNPSQPVEQRRSAKRTREFEGFVRGTDNCRIGCKKPDSNVVTVPIYRDTSDQKFWLYLSRIHPSVTSDAVSSMVKANLEIDDNPDVIKLVPKEKDVNTLSFVSFKIGLDPSLKTKALDPAVWPEGLILREFEDYRSQKFRMPLKSRKPLSPFIPTPPTPPAIEVQNLC